MKMKIVMITGIITLLISCHPSTSPNTTSPIKKGMIKVTILYPNGEGKTFDMDYYSNNHMPMVARLLGDSLKFFEIDKGVMGQRPDVEIPFLAIGYLYFDELSDFQNAFAPNAEIIRDDIHNYTNIQPLIQISEVLK